MLLEISVVSTFVIATGLSQCMRLLSDEIKTSWNVNVSPLADNQSGNSTNTDQPDISSVCLPPI